MLKLKFSDYKNECGTDEAGRGCLAGPVTAAAVILPQEFISNEIKDSKILSELKRNKLRELITKKAISYAVSHVYPKKIDEINILNASILAMQKSIKKLNITAKFIAVDGNRFKSFNDIKYKTIVKGDQKFLNIASASILAKTFRDEYMIKIHKEFPQYGWDKNKGYPTMQHKKAILKYGITKYHRKSFKLFDEQLKLKL